MHAKSYTYVWTIKLKIRDVFFKQFLLVMYFMTRNRFCRGKNSKNFGHFGSAQGLALYLYFTKK